MFEFGAATTMSDEEHTAKMVTPGNAKHLINALITAGECTDVDRAVRILQTLNDKMGRDRQVVVCSMCAKMIGIKKCSGCPKTATRYCSRACQVAAWPSHKASCRAVFEK